MIHIEDLTVRYLGRRQPALAHVNLSVRQGETVLLLGPSGCGKSTLALCLSGLIPNSLEVDFSGRVLVEGIDTRQADRAALAQRVGVVFQDPDAQFVMLDVESELAFGLENLCVPPAEIDLRIQSALSMAGMPDRRHDKVWQLSGGQKQRVALAALLAMRQRIIVFDEPTANLDPAGVCEVFAAIADLKRSGQHTLVLIEHRLDELMDVVDRVVVMAEQGRIVADGDPHEVFDQHFEVLQQLGVWVPQVSALGHRLRVRPTPVTLAEARERLPGRAASVKTADLFSPASNNAPPSTHQPAICVRHLSFHYGARLALDEVDLTVPRHDFVAIVGANGAGKTTLAGCIAGLLTPPAGSVFVDGRDVTTLSPQALARHVGFVFQNPEHQFVADTVADELRFSLRRVNLSPTQVEQRVEEMLARFRLTQYAAANPFTLSHGEKRRLSVATTLMMGQEILILDEPTFGQDQHTAGELMALLRTLHREGRTVLIITHDMTLVAECACTVVVMSAGRVLFHGPTRLAFAQPDLLAEARLDLPPLARLAHQLGFTALTADDFNLAAPVPQLPLLAGASDQFSAQASR
ncbi:MAG: energy-coupling factor transporter ATPase [Anaerolineae bacterium]|nr:energy-coupling factor transporter ATPase [Thermoflexales bacterium]MDW8407028.1 energy-coupling factor transporter ATPase [Anaerolineae bacterium]